MIIRGLCRTGKHRYSSEVAGLARIAYLKDNFDGDPERRPTRTYYCEHCDGWHLTSTRRRPTR